MMWRTGCIVGLLVACLPGDVHAAEDSAEVAAARKSFAAAVKFFHGQVASHGGYVYLYSDDLTKREGEGKTTPDTLWVEPPGTPVVGLAYVRAYERTRDPRCLQAAKDAAHCLLQGQYRSGGWNASIEFDPAERAKQAYRVDEPLPKKRQRNISTLDDDKSQSAIRFLAELDRVLEFKDQPIHEATQFALNSLLAAQFPNGAWGQVWEAPADSSQPADLKASYPADWPKKYPGGSYWFHYTFNDNNISQAVDTLLLAHRIYGDDRYRQAALKAGDFIILAQMPEPQPAWAQQYNFQMQPAWARKFEPPAISGGESQRLIGTLLDLYVESGDRKYLSPIPQALAYLERSQLPDGRLSRFYELQTNRPLYLTRDYQLTYRDDDLPTHYGFQVGSSLEQLRRRWEDIRKRSPEELARLRQPRAAQPRMTPRLTADVQRIVASQDSRGAWVESGKLKYHGKDDPTRQIISSSTFIKNLDLLSTYLAASASR